MTLQTLISTMHQSDYSLLDKMNIRSDAIVVNQCDKNEIAEFVFNGHSIKWISVDERGVGLSRNTALMRANADILLFADDDMVYEDGYAEKILSEFSGNPKADLIAFNIKSLNGTRPEYTDTKNHRLRTFNCLRYGACRIAVKRDSVLKNNLYFSLLYGGGAPHRAGEDNLFVIEALKRKMHLYASCLTIGTVAQDQSSWFKGYDEEYYFDRGFLFGNMFGRKAKLMLLLFEIKTHDHGGTPLRQRIKAGYRGIEEFRK